MKRSEVQNKVFGEMKDFESGQTDSSFQHSSRGIRGINSDDTTFGVFRTSNKDLGIKAGQSTGPIDGPHWRQAFLEPSAKSITQDVIDKAKERFVAKPKVLATGTESLNSAGTTRRIKEAQSRAVGFGADLKSADQDKRILANAKASQDLHPYTGKPMKPMKSVSTGKVLNKEKEGQDERKKFAIHRSQARYNAHRAKYLRALAKTKTPKPKGIKGFGVDKVEYEKACSQVGEHAIADRELRRFVPDHNRSWNKSGLRNPAQTHKKKQV